MLLGARSASALQAENPFFERWLAPHAGGGGAPAVGLTGHSLHDLPHTVLTDYHCKSNGFARVAPGSLGELAGGAAFFPLSHHVKDQFNPGGNAKFVIDAEQIVAYGVLSDVKS
jgi:hypothetical protein